MQAHARRWLVVFLAAAAAVLSFDALRAQALDSGVIPDQAILPRKLLASGWALVIDAAAASGALGVRDDRRDWRAWAMLLLAFTCSVAFQVLAPPAWLARAVPPVALLLAIVVLELPRMRETAGKAETASETARSASRTPSRTRRKAGRPARVGDRMRAYVLAERAEGRDPTGADLDRQFGTKNYGRRVLRELAAVNGGTAAGKEGTP
jgi:hypothetical protein